jgi:hypothetical protein
MRANSAAHAVRLTSLAQGRAYPDSAGTLGGVLVVVPGRLAGFDLTKPGTKSGLDPILLIS